jgi:hypothetical protein
MPNLRIIANNLIGQATLAASTTAGAYSVEALKKNEKGAVWRATGTSAVLTAVLSATRPVQAVVLPHCTLTEGATMRVQLTDGTDVSETGTFFYDSGNKPALAAAPQAPVGWGEALQGSNSFAYGGGAYARMWLPPGLAYARGVRITLADPANPAGYIEASRLVVGSYWEAAINPEVGLSVSMIDSDEQFRNGAGDLVTVLGLRHRKVSLRMADLPAADRNALWSILCSNGRAVPILLSVFPDNADGKLEEMYQLWCKLTNTSAIAMTAALRYGAALELEEM